MKCIVARITASPSTVKAGASATALPVLTSEAPIEGTTVKFTSSNPKLVSVPSEIVIPAGASNQTVNLHTYSRVKSTQVVTITAEANGSRVSTTLTVVE